MTGQFVSRNKQAAVLPRVKVITETTKAKFQTIESGKFNSLFVVVTTQV